MNVRSSLNRIVTGLVLGLALGAVGGAHAESAPDEAALRATVQAAVWPADIVRAADRLLQADPSDLELRAVRDQAAQARQLLRRNDVRLYRSAFVAADGGSADDLRRAALGDADAAVRLALASRGHDAAHGTQRYVGWLQFASLLGQREASYTLARHFRASDEPLLAAQYEALALAQGYEPALALDHSRK